MIAPSPRCRVEHRGAFFDLGAPETAWATPGQPDASGAFPAFEREGASWGRVVDRTQSLGFAVEPSSKPTGATTVELRGRARGGHKVVVSVDGKTIGTLALSTTDDRVVSVANAALPLVPGLHTLSLRWVGPFKKDEPIAEIDWIRVGAPDEEPVAFAPPTRKDTVGQVTIAGTPRVAFTLMAPSVLRCLVHVPRDAELLADAAIVGGVRGEGASGEGAVEVREYASGSATRDVRVLESPSISTRSWTSLRTPLTASAALDGGGGGVNSGLSIIEIAATRAGKQTRVAIAEPRIVRRSPSPEALAIPPRVPKRALLIVLAGLSTSNAALPAFTHLARDFVSFRGHRASSSVGTSSLASLLTGLPVPVHAVDDVAARLADAIPRLGTRLTPFGVETDFATDVPTSGPAFGFSRDVAHYSAHSPVDGPPRALDDLDRLLADTASRRALLIAHLRGAHPPFDVSPEALKSMPPATYAGPIDPRHVVSVMHKIRRGLLRLSAADHERFAALSDAALEAQLTRISAIVDSLRAAGLLDDTLIIVTGDAPFLVPLGYVAPSSIASASPSKSSPLSTAPPTARPPAPPRDDRAPLEMPLLVHFPGGASAGASVEVPTDSTDVAATILASFGASIGEVAGRDLRVVLGNPDVAVDTPRLIDDGRGYQLVYADARLIGAWGRAPQLRMHGSTEDLREARPFEYAVAWSVAADARARWIEARSKGAGREPATIDSATAAAMDSWEKGAVTAR